MTTASEKSYMGRVAACRDNLGRFKPGEKRDWHKDRFIPRDGYVEKVCDVCATKFYLPPSKEKNQKRCGIGCNAIHREKIKEERKRTCIGCGKDFYPRRTQLSKNAGKYCSHSCQGKSMTESNNPAWAGGENEAKKRYKESHPGYWKIHCQNRRARKLGCGEGLSKGLFEKLIKLQRGKCACCHIDLTKAKPHMDHIYPLAKNGANSDFNIQLLCSSCNHKKSSKHPIDFMQSRGFLL